jgi:hypothetical protein
MIPITFAGLVASVAVYIGSFFGLTIMGLGGWVALLHGGAIVFMLPLLAMERFKTRGTGFMKAFYASLPAWARWIVRGVPLLALLQMVFLFAGTGFVGSPEVRDGQYVLDNHGALTPVSYSEYVHVGSILLRFFASIWIGFFCFYVTYWTFLRRPINSSEVGVGLESRWSR